jgi:hypothetical protein
LTPEECAKAIRDLYVGGLKSQGLGWAYATGDTASLKKQICGLGTGNDCVEGAGVMFGIGLSVVVPFVAELLGPVEVGAARGGAAADVDTFAIGAADGERISKFNPKPCPGNCVRTTTSLIDSIVNRGLVKGADGYPAFKITTERAALDYIMAQTDVRFGLRYQNEIPAPGNYVVFNQMSSPEGHVFYAWMTDDGRVFFFDPQRGKLLPPAKVGSFTAYPFTWSE